MSTIPYTQIRLLLLFLILPYFCVSQNSLKGLIHNEITIDEIQRSFKNKTYTIVELTEYYLSRIESLNLQPKAVYKSRDYVLEYESEDDIYSIKINRQVFDQINLDPGGVIVTAKGKHCDFVSRFFTPQASILEDPVTGSAHCSLIPFWASKLNKDKLDAIQVSERIGHLQCLNKKDRVIISGTAKTYSIGHFWTE